jgi:hypothetical protein
VGDDTDFNDKPHWAPDGRTIYFVSTRGGATNVWGRRFDDRTGAPSGAPVRVTSFVSDRERLSSNVQAMDIAITPDALIVPITKVTSQIWVLESIAR